MMKDVIIKITGTQGIDDESDTTEFITDGRYGMRDGFHMISYNEGEMLGVRGVKTVLSVKGDTVVLKRTGELESRMTVQKGVRNSCFYSTPQGDLVIGIFGEEIKNSLNSAGGSLKISYTIDSNLRLISRNTVEISVKERSKQCQ